MIRMPILMVQTAVLMMAIMMLLLEVLVQTLSHILKMIIGGQAELIIVGRIVETQICKCRIRYQRIGFFQLVDILIATSADYFHWRVFNCRAHYCFPIN